ncbi:MAG: hypothetical protein GC190_10445 [Alphaproteobacteria bacterium]|nr:hypothetical protein [Alphaproteobacteria bacterium]
MAQLTESGANDSLNRRGHRFVRIEPQYSQIAIVLVGSFNPRIFNPDWFVRNDLLAPAEANEAEVEIVHQQITKIGFDLFRIEVQPERFTAQTSSKPFVRLKDLVVRTFKEVLPHTPIGKMGINLSVHFGVGSQANRDQIGYKLAPPEAWGAWATKIRAGDADRHGGMMTLVMQQRDTDDRPRGYIQAIVQPSSKIEANSGVFVEINDHFELKSQDNLEGSLEIVGLLDSRFDDSVLRSEQIIDQVMALKP